MKYNLKRIALVTILVMIMLIMTGCAKQAWTSTETKIACYAQLIMPDGTIVEGECTHSLRYSTGWMEIYIDGVKYFTDEWRAVIWER